MRFLIQTNTKALSAGILLLRCMTGLILFVAGAGKVLGWFGGFGINATLEAFKTNMNLSAAWTYLSCYAEFIGGFLLMAGLLTRPAAFVLVVNMLVATLFVGAKNFFMGGAAYPCSLLINCVVILLSGPMAYSIDALVANRKKAARVHLELNSAL